MGPRCRVWVLEVHNLIQRELRFIFSAPRAAHELHTRARAQEHQRNPLLLCAALSLTVCASLCEVCELAVRLRRACEALRLILAPGLAVS